MRKDAIRVKPKTDQEELDRLHELDGIKKDGQTNRRERRKNKRK